MEQQEPTKSHIQHKGPILLGGLDPRHGTFDAAHPVQSVTLDLAGVVVLLFGGLAHYASLTYYESGGGLMGHWS